jgi:beta-fructofuranosidase
LTFTLADSWVWDFWLADDGEAFHLFYLHAPRSLRNPDLRHRNARIGHAVSRDLREWRDHGLAFPAGEPGSFDGSATWTGSVVRGGDGLWRMYYTGSRFLAPDSNANIETIGLAVSADLFTWTKRDGPVCTADSRWYETLGSSSWPEEAWRDPWVFPDADGRTWHMLITARANSGDEMDRGVVGHATSTDMETWQVGPPLSATGAGFAHLEVLQAVTIEGRHYAVFCCDSPRLGGKRQGMAGGNWSMGVDSPVGPYHPENAQLLTGEEFYAGRLVRDRAGRWNLMGFMNAMPGEQFSGGVSDPMEIVVDIATGTLSLAGTAPR